MIGISAPRMFALTIRRRYLPMFHELPPEIASACNMMMMVMTAGGGGAMLAPFNLIRDNLNLSNSIPAKRNFLCCSFASIYINNFPPHPSATQRVVRQKRGTQIRIS